MNLEEKQMYTLVCVVPFDQIVLLYTITAKVPRESCCVTFSASYTFQMHSDKPKLMKWNKV